MYFSYGEREIRYLKGRDPRLAAVIDAVGHVERPVDPDLFSAVVHHIVGQQISTKAQATVWRRMVEAMGRVDAGAVAALVVQNSYAMGYLGVEKAWQVLQGEKFDSTALIDTATTIVTKENMFTMESQKAMFSFG